MLFGHCHVHNEEIQEFQKYFKMVLKSLLQYNKYLAYENVYNYNQ